MVVRSVYYTLAAYDAYGNVWDVTGSSAYTIEQGAGGDWAGNGYTAEMTGTWIVTGTWLMGTGVYGGQSDTAVLKVWIPTAHVYLPLILREDTSY
jgi:hypothetical protein